MLTSKDPCPWIGLLILLQDSIFPGLRCLMVFPATNNNETIHQLAVEVLLGLGPLRHCLLQSPTQRCRSRATVEVSVGALAGIDDDLRT